MSARDELADVFTGHPVGFGPSPAKLMRGHAQEIAEAILAAGYRKIFDGDCGLSNVKDPTEREASEAWMRWANLVSGNGHDGIAAMKQMLTEFGYRKPRIITSVEELDALPVESVVRSDMGNVYVKDYDLDDPSAIWWVTTGSVSEFQSNRILLPATVLHEPEARL